MRIIFLDIDGVLNSESWARAERAHELENCAQSERLDPVAVEHLNHLVELSAAVVVVSSTWRKRFGFDELRRILVANGVIARIIGVTPDGYELASYRPGKFARGHEIQGWLDHAYGVESFVIVDDGDDMEHLSPWHVRTDPEVGLQAADVEMALAMLARRR